MARPIVMPSLGMYTTEGTLTDWLRPPGSKVTTGTPIIEVTTEKATSFWETRRQAAELAQTAMKDPALTDADRQAQLTALRGWIGKQAEVFLGGGRGRATWERAEKNWLEQQFKLPEPDPLAPPTPTP